MNISIYVFLKLLSPVAHIARNRWPGRSEYAVIFRYFVRRGDLRIRTRVPGGPRQQRYQCRILQPASSSFSGGPTAADLTRLIQSASGAAVSLRRCARDDDCPHTSGGQLEFMHANSRSPFFGFQEHIVRPDLP